MKRVFLRASWARLKRIIACFVLLGTCAPVVSDDIFAAQNRRSRTNKRIVRQRLKRKRRQKRPIAQSLAYKSFSTSISKFFDDTTCVANQSSHEYIWEQPITKSFNELILSWNALRPDDGKLTFAVSIKHANQWSNWHRLAEWGPDFQRTFVNKRHPYVHTKHVRVEMQRGCRARGFRVRVTSSGGAKLENLKALFACLSNLNQFQINQPDKDLSHVVIQGVPRQSQMVIDHPRRKDLCSPTSTSVVVNYFMRSLYGQTSNMHDYVIDFADKVHDQGPNIYGNWLFNVAQAYNSSRGDVFYRVERLNSFNDLYSYLAREIPIVVSVRRLRGGATPYRNGHILVVVGYNPVNKTVLCIDPAFRNAKSCLKAYGLWDFLYAWGRSRNLSYIPMPTKGKWSKPE